MITTHRVLTQERSWSSRFNLCLKWPVDLWCVTVCYIELLQSKSSEVKDPAVCAQERTDANRKPLDDATVQMRLFQCNMKLKHLTTASRKTYDAIS